MTIDEITQEEAETTTPGERYVIGGENYEPRTGEQLRKVGFETPQHALRHFLEAAKPEYQAQGMTSANSWLVEINENRTITRYEHHKRLHIPQEEL